MICRRGCECGVCFCDRSSACGIGEGGVERNRGLESWYILFILEGEN